MPEFPTIPDFAKDNYRERVAAGESWLAIHEQAVRDKAHDIAAWAFHEHQSADADTEAPAEPEAEPTTEPAAEVTETPTVEAPAEPAAETPAQ